MYIYKNELRKRDEKRGLQSILSFVLHWIRLDYNA